MPQDRIGVVDIGKTNAKLLIVAAQSGDIVWSTERRFAPIAREQMHELNVDAIESWLLSGLAAAPERESIRALVPIAHGAAGVLVSSKGDVLVAPDYEELAFDTVAQAYRVLRDPFEATFSPFLPLGLNLGRQLYYLQQHRAKLFGSAAALLLYPQFWAWKLSTVMASEITSLGCHSDLWLPLQKQPSAVSRSRGWDKLLPPLRAAGDVIGPISRWVSQATGLDPACQVLCGIHDSNASYLCHRASHADGKKFAVISSGTWTVVMAHGADLTRLREDRDMLANVDALGTPVATARFMGGREYEAIGGTSRAAQYPTLESLVSIIKRQAFAIPYVTNVGGRQTERAGEFVNARDLPDAERGALATLYCALQTDVLLDLLGASGDIIVDGPFAMNPLYGALLAQMRPGSQVLLGDNRAGPAQCGRLLCGNPSAPELEVEKSLECPGLEEYRAEWRDRTQKQQAASPRAAMKYA